MINYKELGAPATRALAGRGIEKYSQLIKYTEKDLLALHGVGPKAVKILKARLREAGLTLKEI